MQDQRLTISQRKLNSDWLILDFCGPIAFPLTQVMESSTRELIASPYKNIALNLTGVTRIDGAGLKLLLILCVNLRKSNRRLSAFGLSDELRDIFQLTRMDAILRIFLNEFQLLEQGVA